MRLSVLFELKSILVKPRFKILAILTLLQDHIKNEREKERRRDRQKERERKKEGDRQKDRKKEEKAIVTSRDFRALYPVLVPFGSGLRYNA